MEDKCYRAMGCTMEMPIPIVHVQAKAPAGVMPLEAWSPITL